MNEIQDYIVKKGEKIEIALRKLNTLPNEKILFVIDENKKLYGSISDGDIRRNINQLFEKKAGEIATLNPITVTDDIFISEAIKIMNDHKIGVLVVINNKNEPIGITHIQDLLKAGAI